MSAEAEITIERFAYDRFGAELGPGVPKTKESCAEATYTPEDLGKSEAGCAVGPGCSWTAVVGTKCPWMYPPRTETSIIIPAEAYCCCCG